MDSVVSWIRKLQIGKLWLLQLETRSGVHIYEKKGFRSMILTMTCLFLRNCSCNLPYGLTKANLSTAMLAFMFCTLLKDGKKGHPSANSWQSFLSAIRVSAKCGGGTGGSWPAWAVESSTTFILVRSWLSQSELCAAKGLAPAAIAARTAGDWPKMEATLCQSKNILNVSVARN